MTTPLDPRLILAVLERAASSPLSVAHAAHAAAVDVAISDALVQALLERVEVLSVRHLKSHRSSGADSKCSWRLAARDAAFILRSHVLSVCLFCGAIAGALPIEAQRLIAAYCATKPDEHDPYALLGLADLVEERGLTGPLAQWAEERQGWLEVTEHEHVWLPWVSGDNKRATFGITWQTRGIRGVRRCTCGMFEHEAGRRSRKTLTAAARRRLDEIRDRAVREFRGPRADRMFVDDPHDPDPHDPDPLTVLGD